MLVLVGVVYSEFCDADLSHVEHVAVVGLGVPVGGRGTGEELGCTVNCMLTEVVCM